MRRFYWDFKESLSIRSRGKVGAISDSPIFKITTRGAVAVLFSCIPGVGEEVIPMQESAEPVSLFIVHWNRPNECATTVRSFSPKASI